MRNDRTIRPASGLKRKPWYRVDHCCLCYISVQFSFFFRLVLEKKLYVVLALLFYFLFEIVHRRTAFVKLILNTWALKHWRRNMPITETTSILIRKKQEKIRKKLAWNNTRWHVSFKSCIVFFKCLIFDTFTNNKIWYTVVLTAARLLLSCSDSGNVCTKVFPRR